MKLVDLKELTLKKIKIAGKVIGKFGTFEIEQVYKNELNEVLEVGYTFPIADSATVVGFKINVGDKFLKGVCKENEIAKREYQNALADGDSAYMMEQKTDNVFKISVGKIDVAEEVRVKICYIDKFEIVDNIIQIFIPTLVTPKYNSNLVNDIKYNKVSYTIDFNIDISKVLNIKEINSPSHDINIIDKEDCEGVEVLNHDVSKDFKLNIELKNELTSGAVVSKTRDGKEMVYLSFMPEIMDAYEDSEKEYEFIVDVSGSMRGRKLDETKNAVIECLKQLDVGDKFNIIPFATEFEAMSINSIEFNEENLEKAITYINGLNAKDGTEILNPLKFALYEKNVDKTILLFTDGQVANEDEIVNYISSNINNGRLFVFGIDSNVNSSFIKKLAKIGNGKAEFIQQKEKIDDKVIRTFARIQTPLLESFEIDYGKNKVIDEIKEENALFNYEFYNVFAKIEELSDDIQLKGKVLGKEYVWKIRKDEITRTDVDLEILFVKQEIDRLYECIKNAQEEEKKKYKNKIIELSEKYNINSRYTSFITVYVREDKLTADVKYQETDLSWEFLKDFPGRISGMEQYYSSTDSYGDIPHVRTRRAPVFTDVPDYIRKEGIETILDRKVNEYYKIFANKDKKAVLTYILYVLYYAKKENKCIDLEFLNNTKDLILANEDFMKLLCLAYRNLNNSDQNKILEFLNEDYKKVAITSLKVKVDIPVLKLDEVIYIIDKKSIEDRVDVILWYLYKVKSHEIYVYGNY